MQEGKSFRSASKNKSMRTLLLLRASTTPSDSSAHGHEEAKRGKMPKIDCANAGEDPISVECLHTLGEECAISVNKSGKGDDQHAIVEEAYGPTAGGDSINTCNSTDSQNSPGAYDQHELCYQFNCTVFVFCLMSSQRPAHFGEGRSVVLTQLRSCNKGQMEHMPKRRFWTQGSRTNSGHPLSRRSLAPQPYFVLR